MLSREVSKGSRIHSSAYGLSIELNKGSISLQCDELVLLVDTRIEEPARLNYVVKNDRVAGLLRDFHNNLLRGSLNMQSSLFGEVVSLYESLNKVSDLIPKAFDYVAPTNTDYLPIMSDIVEDCFDLVGNIIILSDTINEVAITDEFRSLIEHDLTLNDAVMSIMFQINELLKSL